MNARIVNSAHLAFLIGYLGVACALAKSIATWPTQLGARAAAANGVFEIALARHPVVVWLGLPSAVLALHVVTLVVQRFAPAWWLFARDERHILDLPAPQSEPVREERRRLLAWVGWFATIATSGLMYGLGSLAVSGDPRPMSTISQFVAPALLLSLVAVGFAARHGIRARKRIKVMKGIAATERTIAETSH